MDDERSREVAKVSMNLCLAGVAGTIPALALLPIFHRSGPVEFVFLPLPEALYVVFWLFVAGAMLSAQSFYFRITMPALIAQGLWYLGMFWLAISLGYAIAPANKRLLLIGLPVIILSVASKIVMSISHARSKQIHQEIETREAELEGLRKLLQELKVARERQGQPRADRD